MQSEKCSLSIMAALVTMAASVSPGASAAELDGSRNLVCAAIDIVACADGPGCIQGLARTFDLPEFMFVDFKDKVVRAKTQGELRNVVSPIKNAETSNKQLILQGVENGHGWGMSIDRDSGKMTTTISGEYGSFMVFGTCTAL